jgi:hypothetical protein
MPPLPATPLGNLPGGAWRTSAWTLLAALALATPALGGLSKPEREEIKGLLASGTLYARIDIPCETGRHPFGTYKSPLVEVTPKGENTDGGKGLSTGLWHTESTYWGVGPNTALKFDDADFDGKKIEIELRGVGEWKDADTVILFKEIRSISDFRAAFDRAFATQPLQDEHPEWPRSVRSAIAHGQLATGMTRRQAYIVVGAPSRFEVREEEGRKIEVWHTRQERGTKIGFWRSRSGSTGFPTELEFVDGMLTSFAGSSEQLNLDD